MITSDIKKLLFFPSFAVLSWSHIPRLVWRGGGGGTIVITIRKKQKTDENQVKDE